MLPALLPRFCGGLGVGSDLGPGLASESAVAAWVVLRIDLPAGPQVYLAPAGGAVLICPDLCKRPGIHGSGG